MNAPIFNKHKDFISSDLEVNPCREAISHHGSYIICHEVSSFVLI